MRTDAENKALTPHGHPLGGWCDDCLVRPTDPTRDAVAADPEVRRTERAVASAQAKFDEIDAEWVDAVRAAHSTELKARSIPVFLTSGGAAADPFASPGARRGVEKSQQLAEEASDLRAARDKAGERLNAAKQAHAAAIRAARARAEE